jgi:hypothetical protein
MLVLLDVFDFFPVSITCGILPGAELRGVVRGFTEGGEEGFPVSFVGAVGVGVEVHELRED